MKKAKAKPKKLVPKKTVRRKTKSRGSVGLKVMQIQNLKYHKLHGYLNYSTATNMYRTINVRKSAVFKSLDAGRLTFKQLEACMLILKRLLKKMNRRRRSVLRIYCLPTVPVTKKPLSVRMGKGTGAVSFWVSKVKRGGILFEIMNIKYVRALYLFNQVRNKFPFRLRLSYIC